MGREGVCHLNSDPEAWLGEEWLCVASAGKRP